MGCKKECMENPMKEFSLLRLQDLANQEIASVQAETKAEAVQILQRVSPVKLDESGYALVGDINDIHHVSYVVAESFP